MSTLEATDLHKDYPARSGPLAVLRGVSLRLERGAAVAVTGPSGCGKSTLLHLLGTLDRPTRGSVRLDGQDPFALGEAGLAAFRNRRIGFVFQDCHLLPQCSVLENVLVPTLVAGPDAPAHAKRAAALLERVGLGQRLAHRPGELSGGEKQRVAVARALVNQPLLLLADEPTGSLDRKTAQAVGELLLEIAKQEQAVLVCVTHSAELAARFPRRLALDDGLLADAA